MACRLTGAKPLYETMIEYCYLYPWEDISVTFMHFHEKNTFENVVWKIVVILSRPQCVKSSVSRGEPHGGSLYGDLKLL